MFMSSKGAGAKQYKITTELIGIGVPETAVAGEFVIQNENTAIFSSVVTASGVNVPIQEIHSMHSYATQVASVESYYFVMPAEDVTIS